MLLKILFVTKRDYMGKDLIVDEYGRYYEIPVNLAKMGHEVIVLATRYRSHGYEYSTSMTQKSGVRWYSITVGKSLISAPVRYVRTVKELKNEFGADLVIAGSDTLHTAIGAGIAKYLGSRLFVDLYDNYESYGLNRLPGMGMLLTQACSVADGIACVSSNLADYVTKRYRYIGKVFVLENGISDRLECRDKVGARKKLNLDVNEQTELIGTAGAIDSNRGIDVLFRALRILRRRRADVKLVLAGRVGGGIRLARESGVIYIGNIHFDQMADFYSALDVGVVCNIDSLFGRYCYPQKLSEMVACGVPVIAADVGAVSRLFKNQPRHLYQLENEEELAKKIEILLDHPEMPVFKVKTWRGQAEELDRVVRETLCIH